MGKPKKRTSHRKTGTRRSHMVVELARKVNAKSPVKAYTTPRESAKRGLAVSENTVGKTTEAEAK